MKNIKPAYSVRKSLLEEIQSGKFKDAKRLPRENTLADYLNISRTQLRDSLAEMEREGFISRRHGVGTVINRHVVDIPVRMDMEVEFGEMLTRSGHLAEVQLLSITTEVASKQVAQKLQLKEQAEVICVSRLLLANTKPAIYCDDYFASALIKNPDYTSSDLTNPIFDFLKKFCHAEPCMDITEVSPMLATAKLAQLLQVSQGAALLFLDEVDFNIQGLPILYSKQFYADGIIKHTILRKKF